jgi:hypothetical protein
MNEKLLIEINRFREISKLSLLSEGPGTPLIDNLLSNATKKGRSLSIDTIIDNIGLRGKDLTDADIDTLVNELGIAGDNAKKLKSALKGDAALKKALTDQSDNFLEKLNAALATYQVKPAIEHIIALSRADMSVAVKKFVKTALSVEGTTIYRTFDKIDTSISNALSGLYANGNILRSVDEVYDITISILNTKIANTIGLGDDMAGEILASYMEKLKSSSKIKTELDRFTASNRVLNNTSRVTSPKAFDRKHVLDDTYIPRETWVSVDDAGTPLVAKTATPDDENLFSQFGTLGGLDSNFMRIFQKLVKVSTKDDTISEIIGLLKGGKQMRLKDGARYETALRRHLTDENHVVIESEVQSILERLSAPKTPKVGMLNGIFLRKIEPFVQTFREGLKSKPNYFKEIRKGADGDIGRFINEDFDKFMSMLENKILNKTEVKAATESDIKQLKDKFLRLSSANKDAAWGYKRLYADLDKHLMEVLDTESRNSWIQLKNELLTKEAESSWRWNTWKEIINDPSLVKKAETDLVDSGVGLATKADNLITDFMSKNIVRWVTSLIKKIWKTWLGQKLTSLLMTASWKTPKEMQEFLIKNNYGYRAFKVPGAPIYLSAGGASFWMKQSSKFLIVPISLAIIYGVGESIVEVVVGSDLDDKPVGQTIWDAIVKAVSDVNITNSFLNTPEFEKTLPDWYRVMRPMLPFIVRAPVPSAVVSYIESQGIGKMETPQETAHRDLDELVTTTNTKLAANQTIKDEFESWKQFINGYMVERGLIQYETATNVTKNMYIKLGVDPEITKRGHEAIDNVYKQVGILDKLKSTKDNAIEIKSELEKAPIVSYMVKSNGGDFKVVNSGGEGGFVYEDKDGSQHPLNELKF